MHSKIEVNLKTFFIAAALILFAFLSYRLIEIYVIFFVAFILFSALKPLIDILEKKGLNRALAIFITFFLILVIFGLIFYFLFSQSVFQIREVFQDFKFNSSNIVEFVDRHLPFLSDDVRLRINDLETNVKTSGFFQNLTTNEAFRSLLSSLAGVGGQGVKILSSVIGGLFNIFIVIFLSVYMVVPRNDFYEGALVHLPKKYFVDARRTLDKIKVGLGYWLVGQLALMFIIGLATYFIIIIPGLFIEGYQLGRFAFLIAVIAGILEAIPNIGPIVTLIIAALLAILVGSPLGLVIYLVIAFTVLQQAEGLFLVPSIMKRAVELSPIVSILAIIAGFELTGSPIGALLSIPLVGALQIVILEWLNSRKKD